MPTKHTELGTLFRINLGWIILLVRRGELYLNSHYDIPYVNNWFTGIRTFLTQINGRLQIPNVFVSSLERNGDTFIMEAMANIRHRLSNSQLRLMFNWRLFFQVTTLSDLCNAKGDTMLDIYLTYPTATNINNLRTDMISKLKWPFQLPPTDRSTFKLWIKNFKLCFLQGSSRKLRQSLGSWTVSPTTSNSIWKSYISPDHQSVLIRTATDIRCYSTILQTTPGTTTFESDFVSQGISSITCDFLPTDHELFPELQPKIHHSHRNLSISTKQIVHDSEDFQNTIAIAPPWQRHLIQYFRIHDLSVLLQ